MSPVKQYTFDGTTWRGHNAPDILPTNPDVGFVLGETRPVWLGTGNPANNVGCLLGVPRTNVSGNLDYTTNNKVYQNLNILDAQIINGSGHTFRNCRFTYGYGRGTAGGGGMVKAVNANCANLRFEFCEWEPVIFGDRYDAIYGHGYTAYRCAVTNTNDGFSVYNQWAQVADVHIQGCWVGHNSWYSDDRGAHGDGTHNDGIQVGTGYNVECTGNFWQGAKFNALNPNNCVLDADGMGYTLSPGNGVTPLVQDGPGNTSPQMGQLFLAQHSAYFLTDHFTFVKNWCWNFESGFKIMTKAGATADPNGVAGNYYNIRDVTFTGNRFGGRPRNFFGSQRYYAARYDSNVTVNGVKHTSGGVFTDTWDNNWEDDADVVASYGDGQPIAGTPIRHNVDLVTVAVGNA